MTLPVEIRNDILRQIKSQQEKRSLHENNLKTWEPKYNILKLNPNNKKLQEWAKETFGPEWEIDNIKEILNTIKNIVDLSKYWEKFYRYMYNENLEKMLKYHDIMQKFESKLIEELSDDNLSSTKGFDHREEYINLLQATQSSKNHIIIIK